MTEADYAKQFHAYRTIYGLLKPLVSLLYPMRRTGQENIPEGPAIICANHSNYIDPVLVAFAFGWNRMIHFMAKKELRSTPILGRVLESGGVFFVDRGKSDIDAIRGAMRYLKDGRRVFMFPEGTRVERDNAVEAKTGAVRIAAKLHVPIIPVYIPRRKRIFGRVRIVIGKPYFVEVSGHEEYIRASEELMARISALGEGSAV